MLIGFDASRAFVWEATGTENYSLNLLRALAKVDHKNQYKVYLRGNSKFKIQNSKLRRFSTRSNNIILRAKSRSYRFPANFEFKVIRPSRLWTQFGLALETWRAPVDLLFVPAHTLPILRKRSIGNSNLFRISDFVLRIFRFLGQKTKYVVTIHDLGVEYLPGYHQFPQRYYLDFASRYAARHADGIIAVSAATKRDLVKRYHIDSKKIFVVHEGVDTRFFKPQSKSEIESVKSKHKIRGPYILFVGTVQPRKNLRMLIAAFAKVVYRLQSTDYSRSKTVDSTQGHAVLANAAGLRQSTVDLIIAGKLGWDWQEILNAPKKYRVRDRVKFLGHVDNRDLPALYSGASVFALPSLFEGFGLPILEALACGCPVVASDIAPHREIFEKISSYTPHFDSDTNFIPVVLAKPNDVGQWVSILYQYISQYEKRSIYTASRNFALDLFSWEKTAIGTLQVFRKLLS